LLASESVHEKLKQYAQAGPDFGAWLGAYILMPDHLHLFVVIDDGNLSLARWMKALKGTLSAALRESKQEQPFWQKGFFDHVLRGAESYSAKWHYVRENAVRAGLVNAWQEWPYLGEIHPLEYRREL
jgi:putative transposase